MLSLQVPEMLMFPIGIIYERKVRKNKTIFTG